ncbi:MAG TPA: gephyrin-like molybdotransferase Glp [Hyphomicrobiaceae bacterium]|nr:gephyrin-like molybdotransferase Glp [Hyphomicrobiaceae bacterium]
MDRKLLDDCFLSDRDRMRHDEALAILRARVHPVVGAASVALPAALNRILAADVVAGQDVPADRNAAVDGYSFAAADAHPDAATTLELVGRAAAGHPHPAAAGTATAVRVFTGAVMPTGHDTVAMQEDVTRHGADGRTFVTIPSGLKAKANVRNAGEDIKAGETVLTAGSVLRPQELAALASLGRTEVDCYAPLRVAILASGDEIVRPGAGLQPGQVYDANSPMLSGLIAATGADTADLGIMPDDAAVVRRRLADAAKRANVIIASGGASRGEEDHMVAALDDLGKRHLWQLAIKPGRPMTFGQIGDCVVVGLPGNPVAVFVCFLLYVWPMLRRLGGGRWPEPQRFRLPAGFAVPNRKRGRREFWRGHLVSGRDGLTVAKFPRDGSGLISGLRAADGLIEVPEDVAEVKPGDLVAFLPFSEFGILGR